MGATICTRNFQAMSYPSHGINSSLSNNITGNLSSITATTVSEPNQVSGQTALWALIALGLDAMTHPSIFETWNRGRKSPFEGSLTPHRSSPCLCLGDTLFILSCSAWLLPSFIKQKKRYSSHSSRRDSVDSFEAETPPRGKVNAIIMRLFVSIFGVLPQGIKLFGMRGIPLTQACAAAFICSSMISSATRLLEMNAQIHTLKKAIDKLDRRSWNLDRSAVLEGLFRWIAFLSLLLHTISICWVWYAIAQKTVIPRAIFELPIAIFRNVQVPCLTVFVLYWLVCWAFGWRPPLPRIPGSLMAWLAITLLPQEFLEEGGLNALFIDRFNWILNAQSRVIALMAVVALISIGITQSLSYIARNICGTEPEPDHYDIQKIKSIQKSKDSIRKLWAEVGLRNERLLDSIFNISFVRNQTSEALDVVFPEFRKQEEAKTEENIETKAALERGDGSDLVSHPRGDESVKSLAVWRKQFFTVTLEHRQNYETGKWEPLDSATGEARVAELEQSTEDERIQQPNDPEPETMMVASDASDANEQIVPRNPRPSIRTAIGSSDDIIPASLYSLPSDVYWISFCTFNLITAVLYYLVIFDGRGTVNPGWTSVFG